MICEGKQQPGRRLWTGAGIGVGVQEAIELPERETLTFVAVPPLPSLGPIAPTDQTTAPVSGPVDGATGTAATWANDAVQQAPTDQNVAAPQNVATAQNVISPGSSASASQSQHAPVTSSS